jgi:hypothetical protein
MLLAGFAGIVFQEPIGAGVNRGRSEPGRAIG